MALYKYVKKRHRRKYLVLFSVSFFLAGIFLLGQVAYPMLGWYLLTLPGYTTSVSSPLSSSFKPAPQVLGTSDSLDAKTWFVGAPTNTPTLGESGLKIYNISIPKLKIDQATVKVGSMDLKKSLIGWSTSPFPGQFGNNIIFGHSELPQFSDSKDYAGIFTHLMDLAIGDEIFVDYDGVRYKYEVIDKMVVAPTDLSVLEQRFDFAYITLITCVPPGTVWQRGVVRGRLSEI